MSEKRSKPDQYQLRFPPGLRDRVKAYADRHGRSMNAEIIRLLEREFPEQREIDSRLEELATMMSILAAGANDARIDEFLASFQETIEGIVSGRVRGVDLETRERIEWLWDAYRRRRSEEEYEALKDGQQSYDLEEIRAIELTGKSEKFAVPPARRRDFYDLSGQEQDAYLMGYGDGRKHEKENAPAAKPDETGEDPFSLDEKNR